MSGIGEAFLALKNIMLLHERVAGLEKELDGIAGDQGEMGNAVTDIDRRVARLEGFIEGAAAARGERPRLPRD